MPKHNSLLEERLFPAAAIFCHDKYVSQKDHVRETLARGAVDLLRELLTTRGAFVARHRLRKQVSIKARTQKNNLFLSFCFLTSRTEACLQCSSLWWTVWENKERTGNKTSKDLERGNSSHVFCSGSFPKSPVGPALYKAQIYMLFKKAL